VSPAAPFATANGAACSAAAISASCGETDGAGGSELPGGGNPTSAEFPAAPLFATGFFPALGSAACNAPAKLPADGRAESAEFCADEPAADGLACALLAPLAPPAALRGLATLAGVAGVTAI